MTLLILHISNVLNYFTNNGNENDITLTIEIWKGTKAKEKKKQTIQYNYNIKTTINPETYFSNLHDFSYIPSEKHQDIDNYLKNYVPLSTTTNNRWMHSRKKPKLTSNPFQNEALAACCNNILWYPETVHKQ